ncbi:hypothetical protein [Bacillus pseudomycoides]|nr:hypothetical protein [Bacillus pseudomycoides]MED1619943.1 hypothetical protein [Bacillus pseudomycoides]
MQTLKGVSVAMLSDVSATMAGTLAYEAGAPTWLSLLIAMSAGGSVN